MQQNLALTKSALSASPAAGASVFSVMTPAAEVAATSALETPHRLARRPSAVLRRDRVSEVLPEPPPLAADTSLSMVKAHGQQTDFKIWYTLYTFQVSNV